jgi:arginine decarboxylase
VKSMIVGNRIPTGYFTTSGSGESDITVHAGSYHLALCEAGIEAANIITYSSILPGTAREVSQAGYTITHGEVMETIMAVAHTVQGQTATAGIIFGWLKNDDGSRYGGLVCEYNGGLDPVNIESHLMDMLNELHQNGYEKYSLSEIEYHIQTVTPQKKFGTALVAICFVSYEVPINV